VTLCSVFALFLSSGVPRQIVRLGVQWRENVLQAGPGRACLCVVSSDALNRLKSISAEDAEACMSLAQFASAVTVTRHCWTWLNATFSQRIPHDPQLLTQWFFPSIWAQGGSSYNEISRPPRLVFEIWLGTYRHQTDRRQTRQPLQKALTLTVWKEPNELKQGPSTSLLLRLQLFFGESLTTVGAWRGVALMIIARYTKWAGRWRWVWGWEWW